MNTENITTFVVPCSPEQEEIFIDHVLHDGPLAMQPDERAWIIANVKKKDPRAIVLSADLDLAEGEWVVSVRIPF